jgi:hypothetical protein
MNPSNKWIGLVEVVQKPGISILGVDRGAHVVVIAWCAGEGEYAETVNVAMDDADLVVLSLEDVETCRQRADRCDLSAELLAAMDEVTSSTPVVFMDFHTFPIGE